MANISVTKTINASVEDVWETLDDYAGIYKFNPNLNRSFLINGSAATGLGATRQCDLSDGKNYIQERVTVYEPHKRFAVDIYNGTIPLKRAMAEFTLKRVNDMRTEVTMTMDFTPKFGLVGKLMLPLMKPQLRKSMAALLEGNRAYVENGTLANAA